MSILIVLMISLTGCSLFVAEEQQRDDQVCVSRQKLTELLSDLNISIDELQKPRQTTEKLPEQNVVELAGEDSRFQTLVSAIQAAGLDDELSEGGPYTIFAPTDEAFDALPEGLLDALLQNSDALSQILAYHVVEGRYMTSDLPADGMLVSLQGKSVSIEAEDSSIMVNDANLLTGNLLASNGVIHVIDTVLLPPRNETPEDEEPAEEEPEEEPAEEEPAEEEPAEEEPAEERPEFDEEGNPIRYYDEGELVRISPQGVDEDGDPIQFTFSEPLDENGEWQTAAGDAGEYLVDITASDGRATVTRQLRIVVLSDNEAPEISGVSDIVVSEGETISLSPEVTDPDGDDVTVSYSGWMTSATYTTGFDDAGEHEVTISATDGERTTTRAVTIVVENTNRAPVLEPLDAITVQEGETVELDAQATDADGDAVTVTYSAPLGADGTWETEEGDSGTYLVTVTATDGIDEARDTISVIVESTNAAPTLEIDDVEIVLQEQESDGEYTVPSETLTLSPETSDPDGDDVSISYSGWMQSSSTVVSEEDEGTHQVTVTASDGQDDVSETITVTVVVNHLPRIDFG